MFDRPILIDPFGEDGQPAYETVREMTGVSPFWLQEPRICLKALRSVAVARRRRSAGLARALGSRCPTAEPDFIDLSDKNLCGCQLLVDSDDYRA